MYRALLAAIPLAVLVLLFLSERNRTIETPTPAVETVVDTVEGTPTNLECLYYLDADYRFYIECVGNTPD